MKEGFELEAEGGEIVIQNTNGDYAVIPKNKVEYINKLLNDDCHGCIDEFVATLPTMSDYAQDGSVVGDPLTSASTPVQSTPPPPIQSITLSNIPDWEADYNRRKAEYNNNPRNNGIPTLGGDWRSPSVDERTGLIKYYESIPSNELRNDQLEAYQSILNNTYFVEGTPDPSGNFSRYIHAPTDIRKIYPTTSTNTPTPPQNTIPNSMLNQGTKRLTFNVTKADNPNAQASFQIAYTTPEEGLRLRKDFANIKTENDLKASPYYSYVGDDLTKIPTTPIDFSKIK